MGNTDKTKAAKKREPRRKVEDKSKKTPRPVEDVEEEDYGDGDIVSPRRDPSDTDDEPL